jgi:hypothetical protein
MALSSHIAVATHLEVFYRSPVWITPQLGGLNDAANSPVPDDKPIITDILLRGQRPFTFTKEEQVMLAEDPQLLLLLRRCMEVVICSSLAAFKVGSEAQKSVYKLVRAQMEVKIGDNEELKKHLIPEFAVGCRRPTPGREHRPFFEPC